MNHLLTINGGSSSVKFALFEIGDSLVKKSAGSIKSLNSLHAAQGVVEWLKPVADLSSIVAIGHRIVHGGPKMVDHSLITADVLAELRRIAPIDPDHLPGEIALVEALERYLPGRPQVACFDTAFHRDLPTAAKLLAIPRKYAEQGVRRYGFHGLSYAYLLEELARIAESQAELERVIFAHLGSGCSMAAVESGKCIDTTMAFTPTAGLVMSTRSGDIDPGLLVYLMREEKLTADDIDELVNKKSGLLGISGRSADMRELLAERGTNPHAAEAIEMFCYQARKWIGALTAALGGLDALVFSGGIGENSAEVREEICRGLEHLGVQLEPALNDMSGDNLGKADSRSISAPRARVAAYVIPTDEELMIARISRRLAA